MIALSGAIPNLHRHLIAFALLVACFGGCQSMQPGAVSTLAPNPVLVNATNNEAVWERVVQVLNRFHFQIERENRQGGLIETRYLTGAGLLEPWHKDSVNFADQLESTLQSIRRKAVLTVRPGGDGQTEISVVVEKELEHLPGQLVQGSIGASTFQENTPLQRGMSQVVDGETASVWIPSGRDMALEQALLAEIHRELHR